MKALILKEYNRFSFEEVPEPEPAADEVLVAVKACGICGSDVHGMDGSTGRRRPPVIMGHEAAGVIDRIGSKVTGWAAGDRVTFDSTIYCGECSFCRSQQINLCQNRRVLGVSCDEYSRPGAFAEFVSVPQRVLYRLPQGFPFENAALVEPYAIALHAVNRARIATNASAVVIGAGMIGLAIIQSLRQAGCRSIIAVDIEPDRLALAKQSGASDIIHSSNENALDKILGQTRDQGADVSFEAVGITSTVELALHCVRRGGTVTLVGNISPSVNFPLQSAVTRELTILGSCASKGEYPTCIDLLSRGALNPAILIGAVAPLSEGATWFDRLYKKEPGLLKVVLKP
jgi:L-iditol 2-dehydrogenase